MCYVYIYIYVLVGLRSYARARALFRTRYAHREHADGAQTPLPPKDSEGEGKKKSGNEGSEEVREGGRKTHKVGVLETLVCRIDSMSEVRGVCVCVCVNPSRQAESCEALPLTKPLRTI